jgi:hypothetical protein
MDEALLVSSVDNVLFQTLAKGLRMPLVNEVMSTRKKIPGNSRLLVVNMKLTLVVAFYCNV